MVDVEPAWPPRLPIVERVEPLPPVTAARPREGRIEDQVGHGSAPRDPDHLRGCVRLEVPTPACLALADDELAVRRHPDFGDVDVRFHSAAVRPMIALLHGWLLMPK